MSLSDRIFESTAPRKSEYFSAGQYLVEILNFKESENRSGRKFVVLETRVLDSDQPETHPSGSLRSWLLMSDMQTTPKNIKGMLLGVLGITESALTKEMIDKALEPDPETGVSALAGLRVHVHAKDIKTQRGSDFTLCNFYTAKQDVDNIHM